ncbi:MAG TPA: hypothetical protein VFX30_06080, partial [bacterium]|nr:hypothetical protein [bacterium]
QGDDRFRICGDNFSRDVYFLTPWPKMLALGGLLETVAVAATGEGRRAVFERAGADTDKEIVYNVALVPDPDVAPSPLLPFVRLRTTQRRPMTRRPLTPAQKSALEAAASPFRVLWLDDRARQKALAHLASRYAKIRLTIPEAFEVHRKVIEWDARYSNDRIPDQAIGLDEPTLKLMHWAMKSWKRVDFMNRYLAGTLMPRLQLELKPGLNAAGYVSLLAPEPLRSIDDFVAAGRAMQRFWLTLTRLGLQFQPQMAPLIFDSYVRKEIGFTAKRDALTAAKELSPRLAAVLGPGNHAFLGRIGVGAAPRARSLRRPLSDFLPKS